MKTFSILIMWLLLAQLAFAAPLERCKQYVQEVRQQHWKYIGMSYPYHYGVGQLQAESACRKDAVAFDGGMGLPQFMPGTVAEVEKSLGDINMFNPTDALKAQAWYMARLHKGNFVEGKPLWITYMCYNSGPGTVKREYRIAGVADYTKMRAVCKRKVLILKSGKLDLCEVGYNYPIKIYKFGSGYKLLPDRMRYW